MVGKRKNSGKSCIIVIKSQYDVQFMKLKEALEFIETSLRKYNVIESHHFNEKLADREIQEEKIVYVCQNNEILGIVEQNENKYKVTMHYEEHKDIILIVKIVDNGKLKIITYFPEYAERRKR